MLLLLTSNVATQQTSTYSVSSILQYSQSMPYIKFLVTQFRGLPLSECWFLGWPLLVLSRFLRLRRSLIGAFVTNLGLCNSSLSSSFLRLSVLQPVRYITLHLLRFRWGQFTVYLSACHTHFSQKQSYRLTSNLMITWKLWAPKHLVTYITLCTT